MLLDTTGSAGQPVSWVRQARLVRAARLGETCRLRLQRLCSTVSSHSGNLGSLVISLSHELYTIKGNQFVTLPRLVTCLIALLSMSLSSFAQGTATGTIKGQVL